MSKPFDNRTIKPPCKGKPHIVEIDGFWRVSKFRKREDPSPVLWHKAYTYTFWANRDAKIARGEECL